MKSVGVIGLGDMGSGLAKNLLQNGFEVWGYDISPARLDQFEQLGGRPAASVAELGARCQAAYVMVMNGDQARAVILGADGLCGHMAKGAVIIITATIKPVEVRGIAADMADNGIHLIDSPVSGGFPGAQSGTLTMMAAGSKEALTEAEPAMAAVSKVVHHVGENIGDGQTVKACLQSLIGSIFTATFEAAALAAKAGIRGEVLYNVVSSSSGGCTAANTALENIIDRKFENTGSHIATMHKDLTIAMDMASSMEVPLHTAAIATQLFHAGKSKYPNGDNWVVTRLLEDVVGACLHR